MSLRQIGTPGARDSLAAPKATASKIQPLFRTAQPVKLAWALPMKEVEMQW